MRARRRVDSSSIIAHPVSLDKWSHYTSLDIPREGSREYYARTRYIAIYVYICIYRERLTLSIMDIDRQHWKSCRHTVKICQLSHNRLIDNIGDYLFVLQESENEWELQIWNWSTSVQPAIAPLFIFPSNVSKKKKKKVFKNWQVYDWRTKWLIMLGYMDLRRPRVYRRSNVGLVVNLMPIIIYAPSEHVLSTGILMFITGIATLRLWTISIFSRCPRVSALLWNS